MVPARRSSRAPAIGVAADLLRRFLGRQQANRGAARLPLGLAFLQLFQAGRTDAAMQGAVGLELAVDGVGLDDVEDGRRRVAQQAQQTVAVDLAQDIRQFIGHHPHAGIDQADIAAGAAETDVVGFQDHRLDALFRQVQGGGIAGVTAANDADIGADVAAQRHRRRGSRRRRFPQAVGTRVTFCRLGGQGGHVIPYAYGQTPYTR